MRIGSYAPVRSHQPGAVFPSRRHNDPVCGIFIEDTRELNGSDGNIAVHGHEGDAWNALDRGQRSGQVHRELQAPAVDELSDFPDRYR